MNRETRDEHDTTRHINPEEDHQGGSYGEDPLAEFEGYDKSTLNWPDANDSENDSRQTDLNSDPQHGSDNATPKRDLELVEEDGADLGRGPNFSADDELEREQFDTRDLLTKPDEESVTDHKQAKPEKRSIFGRKNREPKPRREKPERVRRNRDNADTDDEVRGGGLSIGKVAWGVSKVLGTVAIVGAVYLLYSDVHYLKQTQTQSASHIRDQVLAEMGSLENRILENSGQLVADIKTINSDLQRLRDEAEQREEKLRQLIADSEGGEDNSIQIEALREMVDVNRGVISKMDATMEQMKKNVAELEQKATNIVVTKKASPAPAKPPVPRNVTQTVKSIEGYSLFSVDLWGGTPLLVLVKGDEIKRVKKGEEISGWVVSDIDSYKKRATFKKGNATNYLQG